MDSQCGAPTGFGATTGRNSFGTVVEFLSDDDQLKLAASTNRFALLCQLEREFARIGLETPTSAVIHESSEWLRRIYVSDLQLDAQNQLRLVAQLRQIFIRCL